MIAYSKNINLVFCVHLLIALDMQRYKYMNFQLQFFIMILTNVIFYYQQKNLFISYLFVSYLLFLIYHHLYIIISFTRNNLTHSSFYNIITFKARILLHLQFKAKRFLEGSQFESQQLKTRTNHTKKAQNQIVQIEILLVRSNIYCVLS